MLHLVILISAIVGQAFGALSPELIALARQYAPQFRLTPTERFFPSSIEDMLSHYTVYDSHDEPLENQPSPLTPSYLDTLPEKGKHTWLSTQDTSGNASYLAGLNPESKKVPVYTFVVPKEGGIVDLFYWVFFPFNLGKNVIVLGQISNHVGDWERVAVRTIDGNPISVDYSAHKTGQGAGTVPWDEVLKPVGENRPLGYIAEGSHGIWPKPGTHAWANYVVTQLTDYTSDDGPIWDTKDSIYPIEYLPGGSYTGEQAWLNYRGRWGNQGQKDCWFYPIFETCLLDSGPPGPHRQEVLDISNSFLSTPPLRIERDYALP